MDFQLLDKSERNESLKLVFCSRFKLLWELCSVMTTIDEIRLDNDKIIRLVKGDITERNVDVIVNAAN
jgi:hypothetical protein